MKNNRECNKLYLKFQWSFIFLLGLHFIPINSQPITCLPSVKRFTDNLHIPMVYKSLKLKSLTSLNESQCIEECKLNNNCSRLNYCEIDKPTSCILYSKLRGTGYLNRHANCFFYGKLECIITKEEKKITTLIYPDRKCSNNDQYWVMTENKGCDGFIHDANSEEHCMQECLIRKSCVIVSFMKGETKLSLCTLVINNCHKPFNSVDYKFYELQECSTDVVQSALPMDKAKNTERIVTEKILIATETSRFVTVTKLIATDTSKIVTETKLITTETEHINTLTKLIATETIIIGTETKLIALKTKLIITEIRRIVTEINLNTTETEKIWKVIQPQTRIILTTFYIRITDSLDIYAWKLTIIYLFPAFLLLVIISLLILIILKKRRKRIMKIKKMAEENKFLEEIYDHQDETPRNEDGKINKQENMQKKQLLLQVNQKADFISKAIIDPSIILNLNQKLNQKPETTIKFNPTTIQKSQTGFEIKNKISKSNSQFNKVGISKSRSENKTNQKETSNKHKAKSNSIINQAGKSKSRTESKLKQEKALLKHIAKSDSNFNQIVKTLSRS